MGFNYEWLNSIDGEMRVKITPFGGKYEGRELIVDLKELLFQMVENKKLEEKLDRAETREEMGDEEYNQAMDELETETSILDRFATLN